MPIYFQQPYKVQVMIILQLQKKKKNHPDTQLSALPESLHLVTSGCDGTLGCL